MRPTRRLTTLVSLLWLNLAMLPCTMAMGAEDHTSAPDCPSKTIQVHDAHMSGHDDHAAGMQHHAASAEHSAHGADAGGHPCMSGDDCCALDDLLFSDGAKKLERDSGALPPVAYESACGDSLIASKLGHLATGPPPPFAGTVRLHALNCVYRD